MGRWDIDHDARSADAGGSRQPARTEPARVEREIQIRPLPDHVQDRDRDGDRRGRPHACQYRSVLRCMLSGVNYVAPRVWRGAIEGAFTRTLAPRGASVVNTSSVLDYFTAHRQVDANRLVWLSAAQLDRFREFRTHHATPALEALYERWRVREDGSLASMEVAAAVPPPCVLCVHALGHQYDTAQGSRHPAPAETKVT